MDNIKETISNSTEIRKRQIMLFALIVGLLVTSIVLFSLLGNTKNPSEVKDKISDKATVYDVTKAVDDKSYWVFESERKLTEQSQRQNDLSKQIQEIRDSLGNDLEIEKNENYLDGEIQLLRDRVAELEAKLLQQSENYWKASSEVSQPESAQTKTSMKSSQVNFPESEYYGVQSITGQNILSNETIFSETLALEGHSEDQDKHIDHYIPANSYAAAKLLNGADVSASVSSQANPQPLTLRITDHGSLPNHMKGRLKDCRVSVAAHGDLSSERVFMRLENLTCIEADGHPIETDVEGYVVGMDGKNGVRGRMAIRDGEMLKRGFIGGFLSGLGKASSQSFSTTSISPLGAMSTVQGVDMMKSSSAEGVGNAFELLAKYNIQRAEQYQPVIQISGGESVHIVFHKGSKLGERRVRKEQTIQPQPKFNSLFGEES